MNHQEILYILHVHFHEKKTNSVKMFYLHVDNALTYYQSDISAILPNDVCYVYEKTSFFPAFFESKKRVLSLFGF